jgi:hypothetical protein
MTQQRWQQIELAFQAALDRPPEERAAFCTAACFQDEELKRETMSLIQAYEKAGDFIEGSALDHEAVLPAG